MRKTLGLAAVFAFGALGVGIALAVTGGQPDNGRHPYVGAIVQQQTQNGLVGNELCSGFLYTPDGDRMATAAHCFPDLSVVYVSFADDPPPPDFGPDGVPTTPGWVPGIVHDDHDYCSSCGQGGAPVNDVAVVHIPPETGQGFAALPAPGSDDALPKNDPVDVVGYGLISPSKKNPGPFLQRQLATTAIKNVTSQYLKLLADPGACEGDSGGPDLQHGTNQALAINTYSNGNPNCQGVTYSLRLDLPAVETFLATN